MSAVNHLLVLIKLTGEGKLRQNLRQVVVRKCFVKLIHQMGLSRSSLAQV